MGSGSLRAGAGVLRISLVRTSGSGLIGDGGDQSVFMPSVPYSQQISNVRGWQANRSRLAQPNGVRFTSWPGETGRLFSRRGRFDDVVDGPGGCRRNGRYGLRRTNGVEQTGSGSLPGLARPDACSVAEAGWTTSGC